MKLEIELKTESPFAKWIHGHDECQGCHHYRRRHPSGLIKLAYGFISKHSALIGPNFNVELN